MNGKPYRIDVHHHHASPAFVAEIVARKTGQQPLIDWTPSRSIEEMDRAGVQAAMASVAPPGVWFGDDGAACALARETNEYAARVAADHPGRFGVFAALPLPDVEGSLAKIAYAFDVLKADGVGLMSSVGDRWLGDKAFAPVMARAQQPFSNCLRSPDGRELLPWPDSGDPGPSHRVRYGHNTHDRKLDADRNGAPLP